MCDCTWASARQCRHRHVADDGSCAFKCCRGSRWWPDGGAAAENKGGVDALERHELAVASAPSSQHQVAAAAAAAAAVGGASTRGGCTLNLSPAALSHRKYHRLWDSQPHWNAWKNAGADGMRRLHQPSHFKGGEIIIDVGSYLGHDLVFFLKSAPRQVRIHTFEPVKSFRDALAARVQRLSLHDRLFVHPFGLGRSARTACFAGTLKGASSDELGSQCAAPSEIRDVADVIHRNFTRVDIMQINCEGCEYDVIERLLNAPATAIDRIRAFEVQFHLDWGPQNNTQRYCAIESGLRQAGFALDYRHPFLWERWSRP